MDNVKKKHLTFNQLKERTAFALGNLGHSAFYGVLSTYFIIFVTSGMFNGVPTKVANKLIALITFLTVAIRLIEVVIDPVLGNIVDNTQTKWGKFKPWQVIGSIVSSILMIILFTGIFGLAKVNSLLFAILFVVIFITLDVFYSFTDISYWGMVPAISGDSKERGVFSSVASFTGSIGWNGLTMIVVPVVTFFTFLATGKHNEGPQGWLALAVIGSIVAVISALVVVWGTKEKNNSIREAAANKKTSIKDVFLNIFHNDQILWISFAYLLYSVAYVATNGELFYYFKFVIGKPSEFWIAGAVATIVGFCTSPLFPILNKFIPRKVLFIIGQCSMVLSYLIFVFARSNIVMVTLGLVLFNFNFAQLVSVLSLTDSIEYGQLKTGTRNEAVTLAIRPMLDKISGAFSNGIVGTIAVLCGMTGTATAANMTSKNIHMFETCSFYIPMTLAIISALIFLFKVKITEKKHAEIVEELEKKTAKKINEKVKVGTYEIGSPIQGEFIDLSKVNDKTFASGQMGQGFALKPTDGAVVAPFDGKITQLFPTRHAVGIQNDDGVSVLIHIGIGTVNMRGTGFVSYVEQGQRVQKGQEILEFWDPAIKKAGYDDTVMTTVPNSSEFDRVKIIGKTGELVETGSVHIKLEKD